MPKKQTEKTNKKKAPQTVEGVFSVGKNDIGFVRDKNDKSIVYEVPRHEWNTALNRDMVAIEITDRKKQIGKVLEVTWRAKMAFAGHIEKRDNHYLLIPADHRDPEIIVPKVEDFAEVENKKVTVAIDQFGSAGPVGHIERVLGELGDNDSEMLGLALERGFDDQFPAEVLREADDVKAAGIPESEIASRRDFRNTTTFTIDPEDAKDFDDALSFKKLENGNYEIGIHIADVSYYVAPNSEMDQEAQKRTTSVYLVDRTIPMLPEVLSNDLCSLRPNEEKLSYSAVFEITPKGGVMNEWFGRTIIESDKRFTYHEAQEIIDAGSGQFFDELTTLDKLAKGYTRERMKNGALSLETGEVKFVLDENGKPLKVTEKHRIDTMRMIEEFMLLANKHVARFMSEKSQRDLFVYRVHDKPAEDRMMDLRMFLKGLGFKPKMQHGVIPSEDLNQIVESIKNDEQRQAVQSIIVRSMAKAIYSTENIGHYGLGFTYYTHFTSPIRRYPDVMVHRLLTKCLTGESITVEEAEMFKEMTERSSLRERDAQEAEWNSIKYKQVEYMSERVGKDFKGYVSGLSAKGLFVAEMTSRAEGMIQLKDIPGDYFIFDEKTMQIKGKKTKTTYKLGDIVKIKVVNTNLERRFIDYAILPST